MRVGVLALQGAFAEHVARLRAFGVEAREVRTEQDAEGLDGLVRISASDWTIAGGALPDG